MNHTELFNKIMERNKPAKKMKQAKVEGGFVVDRLKGKFRAFEINRIYGRIDTDVLRFNTHSQRVQTSQGVEIPIKIAKDFFTYIVKTIKSGGCVECDQTILNYQVSEVNKNFIKVGCHTITLAEIETLARSLNWIK